MLWSLLFISVTALGTESSCSSRHDCEALLNSQNPTLNGTTSQSSVYPGENNDISHTSNRALDKNIGTCSHTFELENSWWKIDLQGVYTISNITIYNACHDSANMNDAQIFIGNSRENNGTTNKICAHITNFKTNSCDEIRCQAPVSGRYITLFRRGKSHIILCEVRINGKQKESPFQLIQEEKTWDQALDYCRDRNMDLASILNEETQAFAELEARKANTAFVWLGLRYTCTLNFWFWVADHPLKFSKWAPGHKTEDCDMSAAMDKTEGHQWYTKPDDKKFNFICEKY